MRAAAVAKVILVAAGVVAGLYFLYLIREVIGLMVIALFLAVALGPAVDLIERRRIPRAGAILLAYLAVLLVLFGIGLVVVPPIAEEVNGFVENVPRYVTELRESETIRSYDDKYAITAKLQEQAERLPERLGGAVAALQSVTVGVFSAIFQLITVLVLTAFLLLDGKRIVRWFERELGPDKGPRARQIADDAYRAVGGYVIGMGLIATAAGVGTYIVLTLLGVPFAVPLAVLMAFLDLIPMIGAAIGAVIIAIVAGVSDFPTALIVWSVYFLIYQQIENNVVQPLVFRRTVALSPLVVIIALLVGASLLGVLGALLAIPAAAAIQILVRDLWQMRKRRLALESASGPRPPPGAPEPTVPVEAEVPPERQVEEPVPAAAWASEQPVPGEGAPDLRPEDAALRERSEQAGPRPRRVGRLRRWLGRREVAGADDDAEGAAASPSEEATAPSGASAESPSDLPRA